MLRINQFGGFSAGTAVAEVRTGAQALAAGEDAFAIDATTLNGTVWVKNTADAGDNLANVAISASNIANVNASTKVVRAADGTLTTVLANTVAQDHDGTRYGIRIEEAKTNLLLQSQDIATTWTNTRSSESTNSTTAPDGTSTADTLIEDGTAANNHLISQTSASLTSGVAYTFSIYAKKKERTWINMSGDTTRFPNAFNCYFDLNNGVQGTAGAGTLSAGIEALANGWYRCWITSTCDSTGTNGFNVSIAEADLDPIFNGDNASGLYLWGAQLEAGYGPTSYIATTTVTVTRAADLISCATSTYPHSNSAGTFIVWFKKSAQDLDNVSRRILELNDTTTSERHAFFFNTSASPNTVRQSMTDGGVTQANSASAGNVSISAGNKAAMAYAVNNAGVLVDGGSQISDTTCTMPTVTTFNLGYSSSIGTTNQPNALIYQMTYFPRRLSTAEMQAKTT